MLTLRARGGGPAGGLQPDGSRKRVRAERLPAVRAAFLNGHHEAVVRQRVAVGIRQQKPASGGAVDELEHRTRWCRRATCCGRSRY